MVYPLINYFAYKYAKLNNLNTKELYSYGVEGLIKAIDKYDINLGTFTPYASPRIIKEIQVGVAEIKGYSIRSYWNLLKETKEIRKEKDRVLKYDNKYIIDLIEEMKKSNMITNRRSSNLISQNYINYPESLDDENKDYSYLKVIDPISIIEKKDMAERILDSLNERDRKIIELRHGFKDGICYTLREMEKMEDINLTREGIRKQEEKIIKKLKKKYK